MTTALFLVNKQDRESIYHSSCTIFVIDKCIFLLKSFKYSKILTHNVFQTLTFSSHLILFL